MRDARAELEYLCSERELAEHGLYLELHAYECHVYLELRHVHDANGRYGRLVAWLAGRGVPSIEKALREMELEPLHDALRAGSRADAVREAAALLGEAPPSVATGKPAGADVPATATDIEALVSTARPDASVTVIPPGRR